MQSLRGKKRAGFHGRRKNSSTINSSKPTISNPDLDTRCKFSNKNKTDVNATGDAQSPSNSGINILRTDNEAELTKFANINVFITKKKQSGKVNFPQLKPCKKQTESSFLIWTKNK